MCGYIRPLMIFKCMGHLMVQLCIVYYSYHPCYKVLLLWIGVLNILKSVVEPNLWV